MIRERARGRLKPAWLRRKPSAAPLPQVAGSLTRPAHRTAGRDLAVATLGVAGVVVAGVCAVLVSRNIVVALVFLGLLGACSLAVSNRAASWRAAGRESADLATELLAIVDEIGAVVSVRDAEGRYILVNRQFECVSGIRRADIIGCRHQDVFPQASERVLANDRKTLVQGAPVQTEETFDHIDGPHTYFIVRHPATDRTGRIDAVRAIATDITDVTRAEGEVRRLITDLEQRVRDRTADLEASNREIDAFTYSASHDLRAPLRTVVGFSEILLEDHASRLDPVGRGYLHRVHAAAERMTHLIDALLDLSHAGRGELQRKPVDLGDLAREALADLRATQPGRRMEAVIGRLPVDGDPRLLSLVMQNLVSNAWKFTSDRPNARIAVGMRYCHGIPAFYVQDNGAGFDMLYAERLFAPFQRLHPPAQFPGAGIGLAIVERVVTRHGGRVWAQSTAGSGAAFYFTLCPFPGPVDNAGGKH